LGRNSETKLTVTQKTNVYKKIPENFRMFTLVTFDFAAQMGGNVKHEMAYKSYTANPYKNPEVNMNILFAFDCKELKSRSQHDHSGCVRL
jgi:hypothetical protein